ncbi:MAG: universal stress protein [Candidatus Desulfofervidaceae bacterium]|nr:universal stress protein [Candidatus Desulfofervidaceae bacterium]
MKEFKKILVPIDFSEASIILAPYAKYLGEKLEAELHVLYVVRSLDYFGGFYVPHTSIKKFEEEIVRGAEKRMENFVEDHFEDFPVKTHILIGDAGTEILNFVQQENFDLIVMGTHGRKGLDKIIFGSVADRVVKGAPCPVLTINPYRTKD